MTNISSEIHTLVDNTQSLMLATLSGQLHHTAPEASFTPYIFHEARFYILISELASHTGNLLAQPKASIMIIEDEACAKNIYARRRLSLQCRAKRISRTLALSETVLSKLEERHGQTVNLLRQLPDFMIFQLCPNAGTFVKGFGQSYVLKEGNIDQAEAVTQDNVNKNVVELK